MSEVGQPSEFSGKSPLVGPEDPIGPSKAQLVDDGAIDLPATRLFGGFGTGFGSAHNNLLFVFIPPAAQSEIFGMGDPLAAPFEGPAAAPPPGAIDSLLDFHVASLLNVGAPSTSGDADAVPQNAAPAPVAVADPLPDVEPTPMDTLSPVPVVGDAAEVAGQQQRLVRRDQEALVTDPNVLVASLCETCSELVTYMNQSCWFAPGARDIFHIFLNTVCANALPTLVAALAAPHGTKMLAGFRDTRTLCQTFANPFLPAGLTFIFFPPPAAYAGDVLHIFCSSVSLFLGEVFKNLKTVGRHNLVLLLGAGFNRFSRSLLFPCSPSLGDAAVFALGRGEKLESQVLDHCSDVCHPAFEGVVPAKPTGGWKRRMKKQEPISVASTPHATGTRAPAAVALAGDGPQPAPTPGLRAQAAVVPSAMMVEGVQQLQQSRAALPTPHTVLTDRPAPNAQCLTVGVLLDTNGFEAVQGRSYQAVFVKVTPALLDGLYVTFDECWATPCNSPPGFYGLQVPPYQGVPRVPVRVHSPYPVVQERGTDCDVNGVNYFTYLDDSRRDAMDIAVATPAYGMDPAYASREGTSAFAPRAAAFGYAVDQPMTSSGRPLFSVREVTMNVLGASLTGAHFDSIVPFVADGDVFIEMDNNGASQQLFVVDGVLYSIPPYSTSEPIMVRPRLCHEIIILREHKVDAGSSAEIGYDDDESDDESDSGANDSPWPHTSRITTWLFTVADPADLEDVPAPYATTGTVTAACADPCGASEPPSAPSAVKPALPDAVPEFVPPSLMALEGGELPLMPETAQSIAAEAERLEKLEVQKKAEGKAERERLEAAGVASQFIMEKTERKKEEDRKLKTPSPPIDKVPPFVSGTSATEGSDKKTPGDKPPGLASASTKFRLDSPLASPLPCPRVESPLAAHSSLSTPRAGSDSPKSGPRPASVVYPIVGLSKVDKMAPARGAPNCFVCADPVYLTELSIIQGVPRHNRCLKCHVCQATIPARGAAERCIDNNVYCREHFPRDAPVVAPRVPLPPLPAKPKIFVHCKDCDRAFDGLPGIQVGDVKAKCRACGDQAFLLDRDWETFDDITSGAMMGECLNPGCKGGGGRQRAQVFVRCRGTRPDGSMCRNDANTPMRHLVATPPGAECCAILIPITEPYAVRFDPCGHLVCADAFVARCESITSSQMGEDEMLSPTVSPATDGFWCIKCPMGGPACENSFVHPSTAKLAGRTRYERVQNFGTRREMRANGWKICYLPGCTIGAFEAPPGAGPKLHCPGCERDFCELCGNVEWGTCAHVPIDLAAEVPGALSAHTISVVQGRIVEALMEGGLNKCPHPECKAMGVKDDACTHMTCHARDGIPEHEWCYFCGKSKDEADRRNNRDSMFAHNDDHMTNRRRCPMYLHRFGPLGVTHPQQATYKYHYLKKITLLTKLRQDIGREIFDAVIDRMPDLLANVEPGYSITLADLVPRARTPYLMPGEKP